jgi:NADPH:quinone reductase
LIRAKICDMRAARLHDIGGTLRFDSNLPNPVAGDGEVVVDMVYASVNPLDIWVTRGAPGNAAAHLPWTPGTEGAGYVDGKPVIVRGAGLGVMRPGVYCDRIAVPAACAVPLPEHTDLAQASALGVAGITAWQCIHRKGRVTAEDRVLVLGASGGVGIVTVQIAKATGATVWGQTTNSDKSFRSAERLRPTTTFSAEASRENRFSTAESENLPLGSFQRSYRWVALRDEGDSRSDSAGCSR